MPAAVLPLPAVFAAGTIAAAFCAVGCSIRSIGLTAAGAVGALLVFAGVLLLASRENAVGEASFLGVALLAVLTITHDRKRFHGAVVESRVMRRQVASFAVTVGTSLCAALLFAGVGMVLPPPGAAWLQPILAGGGSIFVIATLLNAMTRSHRQP